ncbi:M23 family metallopeptidase [Litorihabitans aurantiacus]|uniref:M23ase beta-sheet core domain-containing protein n=1 Tax=Litorihabitans aurantiacus TaxID=1930061 RepID=A0AA37XE03_9MICO|nr:peptidoglycan DD-metalloendopeptidase family protein [Litorihabitans aurantiacus]GMA31411.1 hypothetical protein GCM10025875_14030 [Litorihabitans aurantiacus]
MGQLRRVATGVAIGVLAAVSTAVVGGGAAASPFVVTHDGSRAASAPMHDLMDVEEGAVEVAQWWAPAVVHVTAPPPPVPDDVAAYRAQLAADGVVVSEEGWVHPLANGRFTSPFGMRAAIPGVTSAGLHNGIDIAAPLGYPIRSAAAGTVVFTGLGYTWGNSGYLVAVDHGDGVVTTYNHMAADGVLVEAGDVVREGQIIAVVGNEGRSSGPHLHFTVRIDREPVDPVPYLLSRGIDLRAGTAVTPVPLAQDWLAAQDLLRERRAGVSPAPTQPAPVDGGDPAGESTPDPAPEPSTPSAPSPDPTTPAPSPDPTTPAPSPDPTTPAPSPDPTTPAPSPDPTTPAPSPDPTTPAPSPDPTTPAPSPDPSAPPTTPSPSPTGGPTPTPPPES